MPQKKRGHAARLVDCLPLLLFSEVCLRFYFLRLRFVVERFVVVFFVVVVFATVCGL